MNSFGSIAMSGIYTAANNIFGFLFVAVNSVTQACMSFTSQNFGVGKWKRMDKVLWNCIILSVVVAVLLGGCLTIPDGSFCGFIQKTRRLFNVEWRFYFTPQLPISCVV